MSTHAVSGESKAIYTMNEYSLKYQGPTIKTNQEREDGIQPVCHQVL